MSDRWRDTYDAWKLRAPDDDAPLPICAACEDAGCPTCRPSLCEHCGAEGYPDRCDCEPVTLDDLEPDDGRKWRVIAI